MVTYYMALSLTYLNQVLTNHTATIACNIKHYTNPVATAHSLMVLSREELTMKSPFGINETLETL